MLEILHVENNDVFAQFVSSIVLSNEMVTHVHTGEQAVELCKKKDFDLILQDIGLPDGINGVETINIISGIRPISVAFVTNHPEVISTSELNYYNKMKNIRYCCVISKKNPEECRQFIIDLVNGMSSLKKISKKQMDEHNHVPLSKGEKDIFLDFKENIKPKHIALKRNITQSTVNIYKRNIVEKLRSKNKDE